MRILRCEPSIVRHPVRHVPALRLPAQPAHKAPCPSCQHVARHAPQIYTAHTNQIVRRALHTEMRRIAAAETHCEQRAEREIDRRRQQRMTAGKARRGDADEVLHDIGARPTE